METRHLMDSRWWKGNFLYSVSFFTSWEPLSDNTVVTEYTTSDALLEAAIILLFLIGSNVWISASNINQKIRLSSSYSLQTPFCKTSIYQSSYFNRIVKLWNYISNISPPSNFATPDSFKNFVFSHFMYLLRTSFDINFTCTWTMIRTCPCHH